MAKKRGSEERRKQGRKGTRRARSLPYTTLVMIIIIIIIIIKLDNDKNNANSNNDFSPAEESGRKNPEISPN